MTPQQVPLSGVIICPLSHPLWQTDIAPGNRNSKKDSSLRYSQPQGELHHRRNPLQLEREVDVNLIAFMATNPRHGER
jgi:hypothetical protein